MSKDKMKSIKEACEYINSWLAFKYEEESLTGFSVSVSFKNKSYLRKAYGFANVESKKKLKVDSLFRVASHSKMFTAVAIMQLKEKNKLQLDDRVSKYLPWFKSSVDPQVNKLTIRELLYHSSGLVRDSDNASFWQMESDFPNEKELKKIIQSAKCYYQQNDRLKYSNLGYSVLGLLITKISGKRYGKYMNDHIFKKCELKNTQSDLDDSIINKLATPYSANFHKQGRVVLPQMRAGAMESATGLCSTVTDMAKFASALYWGDQRLLSDSSKNEMFWPHSYISLEDYHYGMGFCIYNFSGDKVVGHGGSYPGYSTDTIINLDREITVSVFSNSIDANAGNISDGIMSILTYFLNSEGSQGKEKKAQLEKFCGRFYNHWGVIDIVNIGNELVQASPSSSRPFKGSSSLEKINQTTLKVKSSNPFWAEGEQVKFVSQRQGKNKILTYCGQPTYSKNDFFKKLNSCL